MFDKYLKERDQIKRNTGVYFHTDKLKITYLGKPQNIEEAKQMIKDLTTKIPQAKDNIYIDDGMHKFVFEKKAELQQITGPRQVRTFIGKDNIQVTGQQNQIDAVKPLIMQWLAKIKASLYTETI